MEGKNRGKKDINTYYIVCGKVGILPTHIYEIYTADSLLKKSATFFVDFDRFPQALFTRRYFCGKPSFFKKNTGYKRMVKRREIGEVG